MMVPILTPEAILETAPTTWDEQMPETAPARPRPSRRITRREARALTEIGAHVRWEREYRRGW